MRNVASPAISVAKDVARGAKETLRGLSSGLKYSSVVESMTEPMDSAVTLPKVDLDKLAEWLGWAILEG